MRTQANMRAPFGSTSLNKCDKLLGEARLYLPQSVLRSTPA